MNPKYTLKAERHEGEECEVHRNLTYEQAKEKIDVYLEGNWKIDLTEDKE